MTVEDALQDVLLRLAGDDEGGAVGMIEPGRR
jgi:hypothetical protein